MTISSLSPFGAGLAFAIVFAASALAAPAIPVPGTRLLVAGPSGEPGSYSAGVAIALPPDWHTYWRSPGDAGLPPMWDTQGSENLAAFTVRYPAPTRYFDGYGTQAVYQGGVVFPATVTAADPARPVILRLALTYGFCREICVPAEAAFEAVFQPAGSSSKAGDAAEIAKAEARVPVLNPAPRAGIPALLSLTAAATPEPAAEIVIASATPDTDVFVEGPDGWYLSPPKPLGLSGSLARFRLAFDSIPKGASISGASLRITIVDPLGSSEILRTLD